jgi:SAM-dependent methyltransferase
MPGCLEDRWEDRLIEPWNHNTHYHSVVLAAIPHDATDALDIGCGEGLLTRRLCQRVPRVVGIDRHEPTLALARSQSQDITYMLGDFMTYPFEPETFDFVASVASLHHMHIGPALERMTCLLRPGGRLAVVGLARSRPTDLPFDLAGLFFDRYLKRSRREWEDSAPRVWPPPLTYGESRRVARTVLPGVSYRRHLLWRYSLVATKRG